MQKGICEDDCREIHEQQVYCQGSSVEMAWDELQGAVVEVASEVCTYVEQVGGRQVLKDKMVERGSAESCSCEENSIQKDVGSRNG